MNKKIIGLTIAWILALWTTSTNAISIGSNWASVGWNTATNNWASIWNNETENYGPSDEETENYGFNIWTDDNDSDLFWGNLDNAFDQIGKQFEDQMDLFEKKLNTQMELVGNDIVVLTNNIQKKLNSTVEEIQKQQFELINSLSSKLTWMIDSKVDSIFTNLEKKVWSKKTFEIINKALIKIDILKTQEKFQSGKNKDLIEYIENTFKEEQINQAEKITKEKASDKKITKEEFKEINDMISQLIDE